MSPAGRLAAVAGVVVGNAAVQAVAVLGNPVPSVDVWFILLAIVSAASLALAVWSGQVLLAHRPLRGAGLLLAVIAIGLVALALAGVASALLVPVVLALGAIVLPAVANGARAGSGFRVFARVPVRASLSVLAIGGLWGMCWLAALLLGFFITGPIAAFATWVVIGAAGVAGLALWTRLWERHGQPKAASTGAAEPVDGPAEAAIG